MRRTTGHAVKKELKQRNLIYFGDVLNEARIAIDLMDGDVRSALAIAVAERVLKVNERSLTTDATTDTATAAANELIAAAWQNLQHREDVEASIRTNLLSKHLLESDWADDDGVAAAIYAAKTTVTGDAVALLSAISRLLDSVFSLGYSEDFYANCAHPIVQAELIRIRAMLSVANEHESVGIIVEKLRTLPAAPG